MIITSIRLAPNWRNRLGIFACCSGLKVRSATLLATCAAWLSAFSARRRASARCASASVACFLADTMSFSNESASIRAPRANASAFPAVVTALSAFALAASETVAASLALPTAAAASKRAWFDIFPSRRISLPDSSSFLWLYGYARISESIANAKLIIPSIWNRCSLFVLRCSRNSNTTRNANNTNPLTSKNEWALLTSSSEVHHGGVTCTT